MMFLSMVSIGRTPGQFIITCDQDGGELAFWLHSRQKCKPTGISHEDEVNVATDLRLCT